MKNRELIIKQTKRKTVFNCLLLLIASLMMTACINIKEDNSDCPSDINPSEIVRNINFEYIGDTNDPNMFAEKISRVTLFVYNAETKNLVLTQQLVTSS